MLPQFGIGEFLLLAIVALIVVGPKDLPVMMRKMGRGVGKLRRMAREFQAAFDDIARQAELDELRKEIEDLKRNNAVKQAADDLAAAEADINAAVMAKHPRAPDDVTTPEPDPDAAPDAPADNPPADVAQPVVNRASASAEPARKKVDKAGGQAT